MALVQVRSFSYTYPGEKKRAINDLSFDIEEDAFVVLTGRSGSGKSTLGKALAGFLFHEQNETHSGEIFVRGADMTAIPLYEASERVAYVQQNPEDQFCTLSVVDEIAFGLENACMEPRQIEERVAWTLEVVQGSHLKGRDLASLSGGEKQKVAIAAMLALHPDVLILDEPTANLDPVATQQVFDTLHHIRRSHNLTVIIIEHKLESLRQFNPDLLVLESGRLLTVTTIESFEKRLARVAIHLPLQPQSHSPDTSQPAIQITGLEVVLQGKTILPQIDLQVPEGEFLALMGPNGSGKSTLVETVIGLHQPIRGVVKLLGQNSRETNTAILVKETGFLFQNPDHQIFTQSIWEEATLLLKNLGRFDNQATERAREWLGSIGLLEKQEHYPQALSYGEKRRLNIVSILLHGPRLLLIDEFLIGQDMANAQAWMTFLRRYTRTGGTVIFINHHVPLATQYCDRVVFLSGGKIIHDAPAAGSAQTLSNLYHQEQNQSLLRGGNHD
jgi:energy-coupling factor transport system ATP-binding protein